MEYYFPDHPDDDAAPLREVPAKSTVTPDWRRAFRQALCGDTADVLLTGCAFLYVVEVATDEEISRYAGGHWCHLSVAMPVQRRITINVDEWVLSAMQAKLSGERHEALARILRNLTFEDPAVVVSDLDGEIRILPAKNVAESLTARASRVAQEHRTLFGKEPTPEEVQRLPLTVAERRRTNRGS